MSKKIRGRKVKQNKRFEIRSVLASPRTRLQKFYSADQKRQYLYRPDGYYVTTNISNATQDLKKLTTVKNDEYDMCLNFFSIFLAATQSYKK